MKPLVSVIAVNYNTAEHTIEMVESVRKSDYPNLQIVVVDNCSDQEDVAKLQALDEQMVLICNEENLGFSGGNNCGLRYALEHGARYAVLLNNDTTIEPGAISTMVDCLESGKADVVCPKIVSYFDHGEIGYAGGDLVDYKGAVWIRGIRERDNGQHDREMPITFASGCCVMTDMDSWQQVGLLDEHYFLYFEDTALSAKFCKAGKRMLYTHHAVVYHKESVSARKLSDNYQYYFCRNRLLYTKENIAFPMRLVAYGYTALYILKKLLCKVFVWKNASCAVRDFVRGHYGKRQEA